jgi:hypothetical protein
MSNPFRAWLRSPRGWAACLSLLYVLGALALLHGFRYRINPDGISYLSIAGRYLAGDWRGALNGYWGPLFSWALVPLLALRIEPVLAGKVLSILIGLATIPGLQALSLRFGLSDRLRAIALAALLPVLWLFTFFTVTPDFLMACLLVWYFSLLFDSRFLDRRRNALFCGMLGGLAYFAKAYGFYFFLAHYTLVAALLGLGAEDSAKRRAVLRSYALGMAVFGVLAGSWILVLSNKYDRLTVSTSGAYNYAVMAPGSRGQPMLYQGFIAPLDSRATSIWEEPSALRGSTWKATGATARLTYQARLVAGNALLAIRKLSTHAFLAPLILAAAGFVCLRTGRRCLRPGGEAAPPLSLLLYTAGYVLITVEDRYLFIGPILLAFLGAQLLQRLAEKGVLTGRRYTAAVLILALSIAAQPALETARRYRGAKASRREHAIITQLRKQTALHGNVASNREWGKTLSIAYQMRLRYFGAQGDIPTDQVPAALARLGVNYYFVWNGSAAEQKMFRGCPEVTGRTINRLRVYQLAAPPPAGGR